MRSTGDQPTVPPVARGQGDASTPLRRSSNSIPQILVVGKNADIGDCVARALGDDFELRRVANTEEALGAIRAELPDMIIVDVMAPDLGGFALLHAIRLDAALWHLPVIMLSARAGEAQRQEALAAGATDFLMSPFSERELLARISANLDPDTARRSNQRRLCERRHILEMVATGMPLGETLDALMLMLEAHEAGMRCGILIVTDDGTHFRRGNGPSLPECYHRSLDGVPIAPPYLGPCGEAAHCRKVVRVPDISKDRRFAPEWHALMRACGIRACRSTPVCGRDKKVLGSIAMYYDQPRNPDPSDPDLVEMATHLAAIAIEHDQLISTLRKNQEELKLANRAKDDFLAMLGHELRNPLAPIVTTLELMRRRAPEVFRAEREAIEAQAHHLTDMVDDLLDVSRIVRGKLHLKLRPVLISDVVEAARATTAALFAERGQSLALDVSLGLIVDGDFRRLVQVLVNLLVNASKYSPPATQVDLNVTASVDWVELRVRDRGIGIDSALLPHVFELFSQAEQTADQSRGGLGLGLAIVRNLVERHAGTITAMSAGTDQGSEFLMRLPLLARWEAQADTREAEPSFPPAPESHTATKVLLVDDHVAGAASLCQLLEEVGYSTCVEHDGFAALATLEHYEPGVALIDIGLPAMDGYELARRIRAMPKFQHLPLIAVTGHGQESDRAKTVEFGFNGHLVKPLKIMNLVAMIEEVVRSAQMH